MRERHGDQHGGDDEFDAHLASVRQTLGRPGEVWLPESGTDRLMVIRTGG